MKYLYFLNLTWFAPVSLGLSLLISLTRWKRRTIRINLDAMGLPLQSLGPLFFWRWCFALSRVALRFLSGSPASPIRIRARDASRLDSLRRGPSLFLTGHFHDWEALAAWMARSGIPLLGSARRLSTPWAQAWLHRLRQRQGVPVVSDQVLDRALSHLRQGGCFGILWDQYSPLARHTSPLFGIPAAMDPLPEVLVRRTGCRVVVGFLLPTGVFRLFLIRPEGRPLPDPGRLSRRYHRLLERVVRAYPTHWFGLCHARFKGVLTYPGRRNVSRETSLSKPSISQHVSRETAALNSSKTHQG